jgi:hypothetical protein
MDTEFCQTSIRSLLERISRLEQDVMELRQCLHVQTSHLERPGNVPASLSIMPNVSRLVAPGTGDWEIRCLGRFHLRCAGRDVPPCRSRRGQSLLKYLLASPGFAASTEVLVECFWPQMDAVEGARNLQVAVHTLRCSLRGCGPGGSDETVLFRHNQYLLNPTLSIVQDVDAFHAAYERGLCAAKAGRSYDYSYTPQHVFGRTWLYALGNVIDIAAYFSVYDRMRHVILATDDGKIHEVYYGQLG